MDFPTKSDTDVRDFILVRGLAAAGYVGALTAVLDPNYRWSFRAHNLRLRNGRGHGESFWKTDSGCKS